MITKILNTTHLDTPIEVLPGDILEVTYIPPYIKRLLGKAKKVVLLETIKENYKITTLGVFEFENEFDCERGIGGFFGE